MRRTRSLSLVGALSCVVLLGSTPALADHSDPTRTLSPVIPQGAAGALIEGEGTWDFIGNVGPMQGTDVEPFTKKGITYVAGGSLGQGPAPAPIIGQRIVQLTEADGTVIPPKVVADHGSAQCAAPASGVTALQHDVQAIPQVETELLIDTTDAVGRCHDTPGGGLEILDVTGLGEPGFEVREIALMRFNGTSHTVTQDATRPGIIYNNGADFGTGTGDTAVAMTWTDVIDVRSCLGLAGKTLAEKRAACKPIAYRIVYKPEWTSKRLADNTLTEPANCHDITAAPGRLYCAALNATLIMDVGGLLDATGKIKGTPLPCTLVAGTSTGAKVTDCALKPTGSTSAAPTAAESILAFQQIGKPSATGAKFLGTFNHPGRECAGGLTNCNTNVRVLSNDGVAVAHEADPALDGDFMFVTDERGGGILPPGATCAPGIDNPIGNGGLHVFDIRDPAKPVYALKADGSKAVFIGTSPTPSPSFCTIHVIEQVAGEARIMAGYYDGGTKIIDYTVDADGKWAFKEVAAYRLPGANTWASVVFKTVDNPDGTRTYFFASNSLSLGQGTARGLDIFSWTGPTNPLSSAIAAPGSAPVAGPGTGPPPGQAPPVTQPGGGLAATGGNVALALTALALLPVALVLRRRLAMRG